MNKGSAYETSVNVFRNLGQTIVITDGMSSGLKNLNLWIRLTTP